MRVLGALISKNAAFILEGPVHARCITFQSDQTHKNSFWEDKLVWTPSLRGLCPSQWRRRSGIPGSGSM